MSKARELANLGNAYSDGALSNRNLIINGGCAVNQRGTVTGINESSEKYGGPDRFALYSFTTSNSAVFTASQQDTNKAEFARCYRATCTNAASTVMSSSQEIKIAYNIEASSLLGLQYGYPTAKKVTLSFWVRSNVTGAAAIWFFREDTTRQNGKIYTINAADTWEYKSVVIDGDTVSGIPDDNGKGLSINWILASGPDYLSGTNPNGTWENITNPNRYVGHTLDIGQDVNDYFDITGVQLEVGDTATPFEHRSYGDELQKCQRYYQVNGGIDEENEGVGAAYSTAALRGQRQTFPVTMRATPSVTISNGEYYNGAWVTDATVISSDISPDGFCTNYSKTSAFVTRGSYPIQYGYSADAEI